MGAARAACREGRSPACWPADAEAACGEGTRRADRGQRAGGAGVARTRGRGEDPRNTLRGALPKVWIYICKQVWKSVDLHL
jgi:hypothetical protein